MPTTRAILIFAHSWQDTPFTALELLSYIALERFGVAAGRPARAVCRVGAVLLSDFNFTGSGERAILLTRQDASPAAVRTPVRRNPPRSHPRLTLAC